MLLDILLYITIVIVLLIIYYDIISRKKLKRFVLIEQTNDNKSKTMPIFSDPVLGFGKAIYSALFTNENDVYRLTKQIRENKKLYPEKMATSLFLNQPIVVTWNIEAFKQILATEKEKYVKLKALSKTIERVLGESVFLVEKEKWKRQRKIMSPSFHHQHLKKITERFVKVTMRFIDKLNAIDQSNNSNKTIEMKPNDWFSRLTLDALGLAGFGTEFKSLEGGLSKEYKAYNYMIKELTNFLRTFPIYEKLPIEVNRKLEIAITEFDDWMNKIIAEKRSEADQLKDQCDLLDLLVSSHSLNNINDYNNINNNNNNSDNNNNDNEDEGEEGQLSDRELKQNIFLFFLAGHETTSGSITFIVDYLSKHDHIQRKCREEVIEQIGEKETPNYENIKNLNYLTAVIKESMRLSSTVGALSRVANEDTTLNGYFIPKGTIIFLMSQAVQMDGDFWENPEKFEPDRWLDEKMKVPPFAYLPFGAGPRTCIGFHFALIEMKIVLSMLLQRFHFFPSPSSPPLTYPKSFTLRPHDDYLIAFRPL